MRGLTKKSTGVGARSPDTQRLGEVWALEKVHCSYEKAHLINVADI